VIEDLHWADPSTLELTQLVVQGATSRLLLYTARPGFHAPWPPRAHHTHITKALSEDTITTVVERTGGVPLFVSRS
jgi:predicted ATPase